MAGVSARRSPTAASLTSRSGARPAMLSVRCPSATPAYRRCPVSVAQRLSLFRGIRVFRKLISASVVAALMAGTASADTLREALVSAYQTNPTLAGQRETLKATDATVAIAKAAGRPQVSATVGLNRTLSQTGLLITGGKSRRASAEADLSVPFLPRRSG